MGSGDYGIQHRMLRQLRNVNIALSNPFFCREKSGINGPMGMIMVMGANIIPCVPVLLTSEWEHIGDVTPPLPPLKVRQHGRRCSASN